MALQDRVVVVANGDWSGRLGTIANYLANGKVAVHLDHPANEPCKRTDFLRTDLATVKPNLHLGRHERV